MPAKPSVLSLWSNQHEAYTAFVQRTHLRTGFSHICLPQGRTVVGEDDQLGFALANHFQGLFVPQHIFATFHNQLEPGVNGLQGLFLKMQKSIILLIHTFQNNGEHNREISNICIFHIPSMNNLPVKHGIRKASQLLEYRKAYGQGRC